MTKPKTPKRKCQCGAIMTPSITGWVCPCGGKIQPYTDAEEKAWRPARRVKCDECDGSGFIACPECDDGFVECDTCGHESECNHCDGRGTEKCRQCDGTGHVRGDYAKSWDEADA